MKRLLLHVSIWLVVAFCLGPFLWQVTTALKADAEIVRLPPTYVPESVTGAHFSELFARKPFARYLWNSAVVSGASTVICLGVSAMAAYCLARVRVRGARAMQGALVAISFFPSIVFFYPLYELVRATHLSNTAIALILPYVTFNLPIAILLLTTFFKGVPIEIEEAAKLDGVRPFQMLWRIVLPLSGPALATTGILVFIFCWNEFLLSLTFMTKDASKTVTAGIASLAGASTFEVPWGAISAAVVVSTAPLLLLVIVFQRRIVAGLTSGGVKG